MESPSRALTLSPPPSSHLSTTTRWRNSCDSVNSPEFEFQFAMSNSQATLHSADELFSDGFLLPLQLLNLRRSQHDDDDDDDDDDEPGTLEPDPEPSPLITSSSSSSNPILSASKRWRQIFKRTENKPETNSSADVNKVEKKTEKEKKNVGTNNSGHELNINIWPFSRSRSAGNNSGRSRPGLQSNRKVSSAPCSRSNSSGDSKSRKSSCPGSPGRTGLHLGRSSPVWHLKKSGPNRIPGGGGSGNKGRVLKLNVPVCMGYRESLTCRSDDSGGVCEGTGSTNGGVNTSGINGNSFSLRGLFSKKNNNTVLTV